MIPAFQLVDLQGRPVPQEAWFAALLEILAASHGPLPELTIALVDDAHLARLHGQFLGDESPTDVMAFPLDEGEGEVVVSVEAAEREAARLGCAAED